MGEPVTDELLRMICKHCQQEAKTRDHGEWIGWFCTRCQRGGSASKGQAEARPKPKAPLAHGFRVTCKTAKSKWTHDCKTLIEAENWAAIAQRKYKAKTTIEQF